MIILEMMCAFVLAIFSVSFIRGMLFAFRMRHIWRAPRDLVAEEELRQMRLKARPRITAHRSVFMNERSTAHPVHDEPIDLN